MIAIKAIIKHCFIGFFCNRRLLFDHITHLAFADGDCLDGLHLLYVIGRFVDIALIIGHFSVLGKMHDVVSVKFTNNDLGALNRCSCCNYGGNNRRKINSFIRCIEVNFSVFRCNAATFEQLFYRDENVSL